LGQAVEVSALIVLNGPPAVGKSTMALMYVDDHPMALRIDVDEVRDWLGAWRQAPQAAGLRARALATAMARDHLRAGHDVVVAQLYGRVDHLDELEAVAKEVGASYHEIVLMSNLASTLERFAQRGGPRLKETLEPPGGLDSIVELYERVEEMARDRTQATVVTSSPGEIAATYEAVIKAIDQQP
jgi:predicted kinase